MHYELQGRLACLACLVLLNFLLSENCSAGQLTRIEG